MSEEFFNTLEAAERKVIQSRTHALVARLNPWAAQRPVLRAKRIPASAVLVAAAMPQVSLDDALLAAQMIVWIFGVDDIADEQMLSLEEIGRKRERWTALARDGRTGAGEEVDPIADILMEMRTHLAKSPLFAALCDYWSSQLDMLVKTMEVEYSHTLSSGNPPPALDEYIQSGLYSIGLPFWTSTALILMRDGSVLQHMDSINQVIKHASAAIRLYNDFKSYEKELAEGTVNSIGIVQRAILEKDPAEDRSLALEQAKQYVLNLADHYAQQGYALLDRFETDTRQFEETIARLLAFNAYFYGHSEHDYNTASLEQALQCLDVVYPVTLAD